MSSIKQTLFRFKNASNTNYKLILEFNQASIALISKASEAENAAEKLMQDPSYVDISTQQEILLELANAYIRFGNTRYDLIASSLKSDEIPVLETKFGDFVNMYELTSSKIHDALSTTLIPSMINAFGYPDKRPKGHSSFIPSKEAFMNQEEFILTEIANVFHDSSFSCEDANENIEQSLFLLSESLLMDRYQSKESFVKGLYSGNYQSDLKRSFVIQSDFARLLKENGASVIDRTLTVSCPNSSKKYVSQSAFDNYCIALSVAAAQLKKKEDNQDALGFRSLDVHVENGTMTCYFDSSSTLHDGKNQLNEIIDEISKAMELLNNEVNYEIFDESINPVIFGVKNEEDMFRRLNHEHEMQSKSLKKHQSSENSI